MTPHTQCADLRHNQYTLVHIHTHNDTLLDTSCASYALSQYTTHERTTRTLNCRHTHRKAFRQHVGFTSSLREVKVAQHTTILANHRSIYRAYCMETCLRRAFHLYLSSSQENEVAHHCSPPVREKSKEVDSDGGCASCTRFETSFFLQGEDHVCEVDVTTCVKQSAQRTNRHCHSTLQKRTSDYSV